MIVLLSFILFDMNKINYIIIKLKFICRFIMIVLFLCHKK